MKEIKQAFFDNLINMMSYYSPTSLQWPCALVLHNRHITLFPKVASMEIFYSICSLYFYAKWRVLFIPICCKKLIKLIFYCYWCFLQMRSLVTSPVFLMKKKLFNFLHWMMPKTFIPLYTMVSISRGGVGVFKVVRGGGC